MTQDAEALGANRQKGVMEMDAAGEKTGRMAAWMLVVVGALLTVLSFIEKPPSGVAYPKQEPERIVRAMPEAKPARFVTAPYPFDRKPWPYRRMPGGNFVYVGEAP